MYEDKLPAQGDVWGGHCHPRTGHSKLECFQKLAELRHCWASPGDSWLYVGGQNDILRSLPSHPFCGSAVGYLTVIPPLLFCEKIKELMPGLMPGLTYSDKNSSCAINLYLHLTRAVVEAAWTSCGRKRDFRAVANIQVSFK